MASQDSSCEIHVTLDTVSALIQHLRTAIGACEVDDGPYALQQLLAVERTLSGLSQHC